jgi:ubiquinone/menaquinone biosynthesis C-methylase UbiE
MSFFAVPADAYDRFMGRYSRLLSPLFADFAGVESGQRVLDVGCGPGGLTAHLAMRVGADRVAAADPSEGFARACADRVADADVRAAPAEELPWEAGSFDVVLAQLVVSFLGDADAGVGEMRRVARPGGIVAACTWDLSGEMKMLRTFWDAALAVDPAAPDEARGMGYTDPDSLHELWMRADLRDVETAPLVVEAEYADFDDYWQPFLTGTGPAGAYCASLDPAHRAAVREGCFQRLGTPKDSFTLAARAWAVRGFA